VSLARLFLSGLLVAGGLILGAFTLHGYFDPDWVSRQMQAANARPSDPPVVNTFKSRSRFVASRAEPPSAANPIVKVSANSAPAAVDARPDAKAAAKAAAKKKVAEKAKRPQEASVQWPWNLFNNN
jgi:hypothetical protein